MPASAPYGRPLRRVLALVLALLALSPVAAASAATRPTVARLVATPASGPAGSPTTVQGSGFAPATSGSLVVGAVTHAVRTDRRGVFTATVAVGSPSTGPGTVPLSAVVGARRASAAFTVTAPVRAAPLRFGVSTPGGSQASGELDAVASLAGEHPSIVLTYADFTREVDVDGLRAVAARGAVPLVTWEPWQAGAGLDQPAYRLARITAGDFDGYLRRWAEGLRAFGGPVLLRFAHEMNGGWYPWSEAVNGNAPGDYVAAWRHVHDVVSAAGTPNVSWVWSPNVPYEGSAPLAPLYPGAGAVDVVALDGYNGGTALPWSTWTEPPALFGPGLAELRRVAPGKQVVIAETASAEAGGSKPAWIKGLVAYLSAQPDVTALVWFDHAKEADWRIASTSQSATALREALAARQAVG